MRTQTHSAVQTRTGVPPGVRLRIEHADGNDVVPRCSLQMLRNFDHARDVSMRLKRDVIAVDPDIAVLLGAMKDELELLPSVDRLGAKVKSVPADTAAQVSHTRPCGGC